MRRDVTGVRHLGFWGAVPAGVHGAATENWAQSSSAQGYFVPECVSLSARACVCGEINQHRHHRRPVEICRLQMLKVHVCRWRAVCNPGGSHLPAAVLTSLWTKFYTQEKSSGAIYHFKGPLFVAFYRSLFFIPDSMGNRLVFITPPTPKERAQ